MDKDIQDNIDKIEELKKGLQNNVNEYNKTYSKLTSEQRSEISDKHFEMNKLFEMLKTGIIDEKYVEQIKSKYER
jgi:hypothetical protein